MSQVDSNDPEFQKASALLRYTESLEAYKAEVIGAMASANAKVETSAREALAAGVDPALAIALFATAVRECQKAFQ